MNRELLPSRAATPDPATDPRFLVLKRVIFIVSGLYFAAWGYVAWPKRLVVIGVVAEEGAFASTRDSARDYRAAAPRLVYQQRLLRGKDTSIGEGFRHVN